MGAQTDCIVCGNMVADIIGRPIDSLAAKERSGHTKVDQIRLFTGGFACNVANGLSRLGVKTGVVGRVGNDEWKGTLLRSLQQNGIDTSGVITDPVEQTSATIVCVDRSGERRFYHSAGAHRNLCADDLFASMTAIKRSKILALGYYGIPTKLMDDLAAVLKRVRAEFNGTVLLDTSSSVESTLDDLSRSLPFVDFFIPSHIEGETLTGRTEPNEIIDAFRRAGAAKVVGVKLGGDGCVLDDGTQRVRVPAIPVAKVVDTTGAGDSFLAGIIAAQIHGMNLEQSARFANAVGSCCVQALGASTGIRSFEETRALIR